MRAPVRADALEAEPYRSLRATLAYSRLPDGKRVVLVTSARRGEGKSTTAVNFAAVCGYAEQSTLLVDADLRNPQLAAALEIVDGVGLARALSAGGFGLAELVQPTRVPSLDLLPAGVAVSNAAELLSRPALGELVAAAREAYEWVVVDAPPLLPIADAAILSKFVDGVLLVVDVSRTPVGAARSARDLLRAVDAPLLGVVANRSRVKAKAYGYARAQG